MIIQPGRLLSHYQLVEKIGEGGMGVVWKAEDCVLHRTVAIKVLPADVARDDRRRQMFLEEARLASSVSDARIVQVHELGREGDLDFIVMEYVEGKALGRILHGRPLPPEKVASLGEQVARALSRAHRKRLLHRDLKPANILVTPDGDVKVLDFGLATLFTRSDTIEGTKATTLSAAGRAGGMAASAVQRGRGALVGTLPYMSPEQARGEALDSRSDIFSFGTILYEMTVGQRPFAGATGSELLQEILKARPVPVHERVPKVPLDLDKIIQKAMALHRADRYQTMEDLAVDLKRLGRDLETGSSPSYDELRDSLVSERRRKVGRIALASVLGVAAIGLGIWLAGPRLGIWSRAPATDSGTVLILPMEIRGQSEGGDYVGRAFSEAIAVNLARSKGIRVLPVPEAAELGGSQPLPRLQAALKAGAGRLLSGALTRDGGAIHASLNLVDTNRNQILWGAAKDGEGDDLGTLASSIASEVAAEMGTRPPKLYDYYLNLTGSREMAASPDTHEALGALRRLDLPTALAATGRLVEAFPDEADARELRINALHFLWLDDPSPENRRALEEGLTALDRLDPRHPKVDFLRTALLTRGDPRQFIERFTRMLARDDLTPALRGAWLRQRSGRYAEVGDAKAALRDLEEALRLDPTNARTYWLLSETLHREGHLEDSLTRARQAVALEPENSAMQANLGMALGKAGRWQDSLVPLGKACEKSRAQEPCGSLAVAFWKAGSEKESVAVAKVAATLPTTREGAYVLARYHVLRGHRAEALRLLRRSLELGLADVDFLRETDFAPLHGDPEFEAVVAEVRKRLEKE